MSTDQPTRHFTANWLTAHVAGNAFGTISLAVCPERIGRRGQRILGRGVKRFWGAAKDWQIINAAAKEFATLLNRADTRAEQDQMLATFARPFRMKARPFRSSDQREP